MEATATHIRRPKNKTHKGAMTHHGDGQLSQQRPVLPVALDSAQGHICKVPLPPSSDEQQRDSVLALKL